MRRVLVSGSAGFIGGYLVAELLKKSYEVTGVDDYSKYGKVRRSYDDHPRYRLVIGDAGDAGLMTDLLAGCDHFVAGAALVGGIGYFHAFPYDLLAANERIIAGSCDAALAAHRAGRLRKVTYISSSMVYEGTRHWPSREGDERDIPPPPSAYGFQKLAVEYFARAAWQQYGLPYTIVRPFNCVGAGEYEPVRDTGGAPGNAALALCHVVPDLVRKALTGQDPLRVLGSGDQVRHYTYGGDLARGIVAAMEHPRAAGQDFNLSSARATTVRELAALIWRLTRGDGVPPRIRSGLASFGMLPGHLLLAAHGLLVLFGGDFFSHRLGLVSGLAMLHWVGLGLAAWALCTAIRRLPGRDDLVSQLLAAGIVANLAAYVCGLRAVDLHSTREIAAVLPLSAALAGRLLAPRLAAARMAPALLVVGTGYLLCLGREIAAPPQPGGGQELARWLESRQLTSGLAPYWQAESAMLASGGRIQLAPMAASGLTVVRGGWETDADWFDPRRHAATFAVLPPGQAGVTYPWTYAVRAAFGQPARIYYAGGYTVLVWDRNLLSELKGSG